MKFLTDDIFKSQNHFLLQVIDVHTVETTGFEHKISRKYPDTSPTVFREEDVNNNNLCTKESESIPGTLFIMETMNNDKAIINIFRPKQTTDSDFNNEENEFYFQEALSSLKDYFFGCTDEIRIDVSLRSFKENWHMYGSNLKYFEEDMRNDGYNIEIIVYN